MAKKPVKNEVKEEQADWAKALLDTNTPLEVEPFAKSDKKEIVEEVYNPNIVSFNGFRVIASRPKGGKKVAYPARIDEDINSKLDSCQGSKNAVMMAVLRFGFAELEKQGKTLISD